MSKIYKIKRVRLSKMFLGMVAIASVFAVIRLMIMVSVAMSTGDKEAIVAAILECLVMPFGAGIGGVFLGMVYNLVSPRIGQFEVEVEEVEDLA